MNELTSRQRVLRTLQGEPVDRPPFFSGMGNVMIQALNGHGYRFAEVHSDAEKMAEVAMDSYRLFGYESVVVPFDLGIEAEALGSRLNVYANREDIVYPTVQDKPAKTAADIQVPADLSQAGRVPVVAAAIRRVKETVGQEVTVASYVLGPLTLAGQLIELDYLLKLVMKDPEETQRILDKTIDIAAKLAQIYVEAGADFICVREMGATSDVLSPRTFKKLVQPALATLHSRIPGPSILHICGSTDNIVEAMADVGATGISVDQKNDLARTMSLVGDRTRVFGNLDPYNLLVKGTPEEIEHAVQACLETKVHGVMPGCDLWPDVPEANIETLMRTVRNYGGSR